jgi:hypothetical protein
MIFKNPKTDKLVWHTYTVGNAEMPPKTKREKIEEWVAKIGITITVIVLITLSIIECT